MSQQLNLIRLEINKMIDSLKKDDFMDKYLEGKEFHISFQLGKPAQLWWEDPKEVYNPIKDKK